MTPHPFIYAHLECSQGVGRPISGRTDVRVLRMRTYPLSGSPYLSSALRQNPEYRS
jgi:hypothetical protein